MTINKKQSLRRNLPSKIFDLKLKGKDKEKFFFRGFLQRIQIEKYRIYKSEKPDFFCFFYKDKNKDKTLN